MPHGSRNQVDNHFFLPLQLKVEAPMRPISQYYSFDYVKTDISHAAVICYLWWVTNVCYKDYEWHFKFNNKPSISLIQLWDQNTLVFLVERLPNDSAILPYCHPWGDPPPLEAQPLPFDILTFLEMVPLLFKVVFHSKMVMFGYKSHFFKMAKL